MEKRKPDNFHEMICLKEKGFQQQHLGTSEPGGEGTVYYVAESHSECTRFSTQFLKDGVALILYERSPGISTLQIIF